MQVVFGRIQVSGRSNHKSSELTTRLIVSSFALTACFSSLWYHSAEGTRGSGSRVMFFASRASLIGFISASHSTGRGCTTLIAIGGSSSPKAMSRMTPDTASVGSQATFCKASSMVHHAMVAIFTHCVDVRECTKGDTGLDDNRNPFGGRPSSPRSSTRYLSYPEIRSQ